MDVTSDSLLEETFYPLSNKSIVYKVKVTNKQLILNRINGYSSKEESIDLNDIIGCRCTRKKRQPGEICICHPVSNRKVHQPVDMNVNQPLINTVGVGNNVDISAYLHVYAYVIRNFMIKNGTKRERYTITLTFRSYKSYEENMKEAQKWKRTIRQLISTPIYPSLYAPRDSDSTNSEVDTIVGDSIVIILNPKSGVGKSREIFRQKLLPLLVEADLDYELHVTKNQHDARNLIKNSNIYKWMRGIITIGGDGVLFEVINGIMERQDWKKVLENITFGIVPGGSGNGLAKSLCHLNKEPYDEDPALISSLNIIRGASTPVDLVRIETHSEVVYSFLSVGWGLLADIDIESESLRAIGSQRFAVYSIARLIGLRTYPGRLSFLKIPKEKLKYFLQQDGDSDDADSSFSVDECAEATETKSTRSVDMRSVLGDIPSIPVTKADRRRKESFYSIMSQKSDYMSVENASSYQSLPEVINKIDSRKSTMYGPPSLLPPLSHPVPKNWEIYQDDFILVHAVYQSHIGEDAIFAPQAKPRDGIIWLAVIRNGITRAHLLQFLLGLSSGTHLNVPGVEMIPVLAFRLEPFTNGSHIVVDGEVIEHGPFQAEIFPGMMSIYTRSS